MYIFKNIVASSAISVGDIITLRESHTAIRHVMDVDDNLRSRGGSRYCRSGGNGGTGCNR